VGSLMSYDSTWLDIIKWSKRVFQKIDIFRGGKLDFLRMPSLAIKCKLVDKELRHGTTKWNRVGLK
jgi:hypothetical protein